MNVTETDVGLDGEGLAVLERPLQTADQAYAALDRGVVVVRTIVLGHADDDSATRVGRELRLDSKQVVHGEFAEDRQRIVPETQFGVWLQAKVIDDLTEVEN